MALSLTDRVRHHSAAHTAERLCCLRAPLNGRKVHRGAIRGGTSRAFRSQAADSVSAMLACARALRCVFFFSTSPAQKRRHRLSAGITPIVHLWGDQSWVVGMYIVGQWPQKWPERLETKVLLFIYCCSFFMVVCIIFFRGAVAFSYSARHPGPRHPAGLYMEGCVCVFWGH